MPSADLASARVRSVKPSLIRALHDARRPTSLNLGLGQPSLPVERAIIDAGLERLTRGDMGYTANAGLARLRTLIAERHALPNAKTGDHVVVTCGAQEAIFAAMAALLDPGDELVLPDPIFPGYAMAAALLGVTCRTVTRYAANGFRLRSKDVENALTPQTKMVVVNSPCNPTGAIDTPEECQQLAELAERRGLAILSDEIYSDLNYTGRPFVSPANFGDRTIVISGLSKNCAMTGFRLGYLVAPIHYVAALTRAHAIATTCAPTLAQHMGEFVFEHPEWLTRSLPVYAQRRANALDAMRTNLPQIRCIEPEGAFYLFADFSDYTTDSLDFAMHILREADVITSPGAAFGEAAPGWLRLSYAGEMETFTEGVVRIARFLTPLKA
jgi:aspartate/methionine/tyrosine aminotransferase